MEGIQIAVEREGAQQDIAVVKVTGYIDTTTSSELERVIQNLIREQRYKIIIQLKEVEYISSAGWGIFISEIKNIRNNHGDLKLVNMSESVLEVYELLEFSTILSAVNNIAEGVQAFEGKVEKAPEPAMAAPRGNPVRSMEEKARWEAIADVTAESEPVPRKIIDDKVSLPTASSIPPPTPDQVEKPESSSAPGSGLLPLIDRIQQVIKAHPEWGAWKIKQELNCRRGNRPKVGWGEVKAELKYGGLNKKNGRYKYARG